MFPMTKSNRFAIDLRGTAIALVIAGVSAVGLTAPTMAQESVTTTRTTTYYDNGPTRTATTQEAYSYDDDNGYAYPPAPAYAYRSAPPPPVGISVTVPFVHIGVGY